MSVLLSLASFSYAGTKVDLCHNGHAINVSESAVPAHMAHGDALPATWYRDTDGDGHGDASHTTAACAQPSGYAAIAGDCDDVESGVHPGAVETCGDGVDQDCDGADPTCDDDSDGDGYGIADGDCDDSDADVSPGATEVPLDGVDDNCDTLDYCTSLFCDLLADLVVADNATLADPMSRAVDSYVYSRGLTGFDLEAPLPTLGASGLDVADLDQDGYLDIVFANFGPNESYIGASTSYVYWGSAAGYSTADRQSLSTEGANDVVAGDVDHDGWLDLVFAEGSGPSTIFFGGAVGFTAGNTQDLSCGLANDVALADLDGDHLLEIFMSSHFVSAGEDAVCTWYGDDDWLTRVDVPEGSAGVALGDYDEDGDVDLASSILGSYEIRVYLGDGTGGMVTSSWATITTAMQPGRLVTADFNGDGNLDLAAGANGSDLGAYILGNGDGTFAAPLALPVAAEPAGFLSTGDIDDDGYPDLAMPLAYDNDTNTRWNEALVFWGGPTGLSSADTTSVAGITPYGTRIVTVDNVVRP